MINGVPLYQVKADLFKSLGHPVRIRVLELLAERDHAVYELLEQIDVEQANLSQQLAVLRRTGLVRQRRDSGEVIYSLVVPEARELLLSARRLLRQMVSGSHDLGVALDSSAESADGEPVAPAVVPSGAPPLSG